MICPTCRQIEAIDRLNGSRSSRSNSGGDSLEGNTLGWFIVTTFLMFDAYHHFAILKFIWLILKVSVYAMCLGFFWADPASFGI